MIRYIISTVLFILILSQINAQPIFPEKGPLYDDSTVPRIDISIDPETLDWLYEHENLENDIEFSSRFIFSSGDIVDTIEPVGFRLRGNTSRYSDKKSFKVSFNTFTSGAKYFGVEKLNLNGEHNDPSVMRAKIGWDILRKWKIAAPRANHVEVYINGDYYGLYLNTEHIDEEFIKSRFEKNDGNLYKCLYPADLDYLGSDPDAYKLMAGDRRVYELKINEEADDYSDLANFIHILNNTPNDELVCELDEVFNIYDYLKVIAFDVLTGNWDGPIYNKNNFYLYHNTTTNKFEYIPYDLDNSLGIDWFGIDWTSRNIYNWSQSGQPRPIYTSPIDNQELRNQYSEYIRTLVTTTIDFDSLNEAMVAYRNKLLPYIANDTYYNMDYGFTTADFLNSIATAYGSHVKYGLDPYFRARSASILTQVENEDMKPVIKYIKDHKASSSEIQLSAYVYAKNNPVSVSLEYSQDESNWNSILMYDDGNHNDGLANDNIYGASIIDFSPDDQLIYQILAEDANQNSNLMPCEPNIIPSEGDKPLLYINEFMASNDNTIADENGNYGDWIEVYNGSGDNIYLGDKYLSDNLGSPTKWQMPDFMLNSGGFVLFWADGKPEDGDFHTSFKLSKDGEEIGIFSENSSPIDEIVFGAQATDISYGRESDGNANWIFFEQATPGSSNSPDAINDTEDLPNFKVYPNPANGEIVSLNKKLNFSVFNCYGQLVEKQYNYDFINISKYNKGLYIIVSDEGWQQKLIVN